ncbi:hypothetical protein AB0B94_30945 [Micromonospora sp. NPDC048986]|uniref:hypothetical protein n=1 Tax=Micromonospora sp. NPDC048986 TaxID=3155644 RepID=UPI0033FC13A7
MPTSNGVPITTDRHGQILRADDWVYYSGSRTAYRGMLMEVTEVSLDATMTLRTATGHRLSNVQRASVRYAPIPA